MDLERAASMIKALPFMSKTIVDDTIYEKILSFLTLVLSNHSQQDILALDQTCHFYDHIHKACFDTPDQDYRVITLCIRLTGQLVYYGGNTWFQSLEQQHPTLLHRISTSITSSEATLRCACIEACRLFLSSTRGQYWLKNNKETASLIMYALLDQSTYVVSEACQLFSALLRLQVDPLLQMMDPTTIVHSILQSKGDQHQIMSALDFCWTLVSIKDKKEPVIQFIRSRQLMHLIIPLLNSHDRMIRLRLLEILSALFSWDDDPLDTLGLQHTTPGIEQAYITLSEASIKTIREATTMDQLTTAISLLETVFVLLKRTSMDLSKDAYLALSDLAYICLDQQAQQPLLKSNRTRNNILQLVVRLIDALIKINPNHACVTQALCFDVLTCETAYTDTRVLKEALTLLIDTLKSINDIKTLQTTWTRAIHVLVLIITKDSDILDCKSLSILLSSIDILLSHDPIGSLVADSESALLADALGLKFIDTAWDIRDAAIHFVGQLFDTPHCKFKIQFSLTHHLPLQVFERIHDTESYVRASAIEVLRRMMVCKEGWEYIQQNQVSRDLASQLPRFLHDTEAFVRRATLDAIVCLTQHRSCQGMAMEIESNDYSLNPLVLQNLIQDDDTEVRIRTCRLLESLRYLYYHEQQQQKKRSTLDPPFIFFHHIKAAELLAEAAIDTNRVVRMEAIRVIESILSEYQSPHTTSTKRVREQDMDSFDTQFIAILSQVNLDQQKQTLDPEHLYEEAFDINADMMTQSIVPNNPDDDMNMLDCY